NPRPSRRASRIRPCPDHHHDAVARAELRRQDIAVLVPERRFDLEPERLHEEVERLRRVLVIEVRDDLRRVVRTSRHAGIVRGRPPHDQLVKAGYPTRVYTRSKSCSQVEPSCASSQPPRIVRSSSLSVPVKRCAKSSGEKSAFVRLSVQTPSSNVIE